MGPIKAFASHLRECPSHPGEQWLPIEGTQGRYLISSLGRAWSNSKCKLLTAFKMDNGYWRVNLTLNGKSRLYSVHRLVAQAFLENPENKAQVNHKFGNKQNNEAVNLEWATQPENARHAVATGLASIGEERPDAKLNADSVCAILKDRYLNRMAEPALAHKYKVSRASIRNVIHGRTWKHIDCEERALISSYKRLSTKGMTYNLVSRRKKKES